MKKINIIICFILAAVLFTGCKSDAQTPAAESPTEKVEDDAKNSTPGSEDAALTDIDGSEIPEEEGTKLSFEEIEKLAEECVYHVHWYTSTEGDYSAGTAFIMDSGRFGEKLLVTAFHFLIPDGEEGSFKGKDLPEYVQGGVVSYAKGGANTGATLKNCIIIDDVEPVPATNKDVAAFTMYNADGLKTLPLSTHSVNNGDTLYLLANLWDTDEPHENCVYECKAYQETNGELIFTLDPKYGTTGASGGPIINEYGEVVAIHMASTRDNSYLFGHSADSFKKQIDAGRISDITYNENVAESVIENYIEDVSEQNEEVEHIYHESDLRAETLFFNIEITGTEITDSLSQNAAPDGRKYAVVSMDLNTEGFDQGDFYLSSSDFAMVWSDGYSMPYDGTETEGIEGEEILIRDNFVNSVKLAFEIPLDPEYLILYFIDYYYDSDDVLHEVSDHYFTIPVSGF